MVILIPCHHHKLSDLHTAAKSLHVACRRFYSSGLPPHHHPPKESPGRLRGARRKAPPRDQTVRISDSHSPTSARRQHQPSPTVSDASTTRPFDNGATKEKWEMSESGGGRRQEGWREEGRLQQAPAVLLKTTPAQSHKGPFSPSKSRLPHNYGL